ncbi:major facilitator superfamily MFS_1 [Rhodomicrobium vannielii ATCC 17100]|uniref:Major facilitator superfamily MFS_1 n=2 Tax=Rhodomicrobium vannielii TaxID=1069 RepID=E3I4W7_RHOVT|nr:major facilitator superfamily MFS_1 [Rhodomicrobium vannielii ATCC 17100]
MLMNGHVKGLYDRLGLARMAISLRHRNYRLFFIGQSISNVGSWMQKIAISWLVYRMTDSVFMLGFATFVGQLPSFVISPFAGVLADRCNRRTLMLVLQTSQLLVAATLAAIVCLGVAQVWQLLLLNCLIGILNACDLPVRQSFTAEMIGEGEASVLSNAIALNSTMMNLAKLIGPVLAGTLITIAGEGVCFIFNAVSFLAVLASLCMMRVPRRKLPPRGGAILGELLGGLRYARHHSHIRRTLVLLSVFAFLGQPHISLLPVFAKEVLGGGPDTLGVLMACQGLGAVCGAMYLAGRASTEGIERCVALACMLYSACLFAFTCSQNQALSMALLVVTGFAMMVQMAGSNTILQTHTGADMRGRIMSFYAVAVMGMTPLGSLIAGGVADRIGVADTVAIGAGLCLLAGLGSWRLIKSE